MIRRRFIAAVLAVACSVTVGAAAADNWNTMFEQDFSSVPDGTVLPEAYKSGNTNFDAQIKNGRLEMKSDSVCGFEIGDDTSVKSHGMDFAYFENKVSKRSEPVEFEGVIYEYQGLGGNVSYITVEKDGKGAIMQRTYTYTGKFGADGVEQTKENVLRTNFARIHADAEGIFTADDNTAILEAVVYANEENADTNFIKFRYSGNDGKTKSVDVTQEQLLALKEANGGDPWVTVRFELTDIDMTVKGVEKRYNFSINTPEYTRDVNYIHSLTVRKPDESEKLEYNSAAKRIIAPVSTTSLFGDVRVSFDLTIPSGNRLIEGINYNDGHNGFAAYIADEKGNAMARVEGDAIGGDSPKLKLTTSGKELCEVDLLDKTLTITVQTDRENRTYSVTVADGGDELAKADGISLMNEGDFADMQYFAFEHNADSTALMTALDNISVSAALPEEYTNCADDYEALDIPQAGGTPVKANFELPTVGSIHASNITWESSDDSIISIAGNTAVISGAENERTVTLTATVTNGAYSFSKQFEVRIAAFGAMFSDISDIYSAVKTTETADGINASLRLSTPGIIGNITFAAISSDKNTGAITDRKYDVRTSASSFGALNFAVSGLKKNANDEIKYYLWDENNVSLINLAPTDIKSLEAAPKVKAVVLKWDECFDDNDSLIYKIYRGGAYIGETADNTYTDTDVTEGTAYDYSVVPFDTNDNRALDAAVQTATLTITDYWTAESANAVQGMFASDPVRAAYVEETTDNGEKCIMAPAVRPEGGVYGIYYHAENIKSTDNDVVVSVTYLDGDGQLIFFYNKIMPEGATDSGVYNPRVTLVDKMTGTNTWKTVTHRMTDAQFRKSAKLSAGDFGFTNVVGKPLYVKKVEVIKGELYD